MIKKKRLLILTDNYLPRRDGVVRFLTEILPRLQKEFDITILCPHHNELDINNPEIRIVTIPLSKRYVGDFYLPKFKPLKIFREVVKADIVFSQTIGTIGATGLFLAQKTRKKTVSFIHSLEWELVPKTLKQNFFKKITPRLVRKITRALYSKCTSLIVPSENIGNQLTWEKILTPRIIVNLGTDTDQFKPVTKEMRTERRKQLGFKEEDIVLGYHGRLSREKDVETLLRAFVKLRKEHKQLRCLIIGSGVKSIERKLQNQPGLTLIHMVNNVEYYLPLLDIYCLPSLTETTSLSVLEAMSCELPVIATQVGFVKDYITPYVTGLFFRKKDSFNLVQVIEEVLDKKELREQLGKQARLLVQERFNWDRAANKIMNFFHELQKEINTHQKDTKKDAP